MTPRILVLGATSLVGHWLLQRLAATDHVVIAFSRKERPTGYPDSIEWRIGDVLAAHGTASATDSDTVVSLLPLWLLPRALKASCFKESRRIIALGSTSVLSKSASPDPKERCLAERLRTAESDLIAIAKERNASLTLLRPTMIYDGGRDKNITRIAHLLQTYRCFPIFGKGKGLRQPVHADDVANAILASVTRPRLTQTAYNLSGGEVITYRQMIRRIAAKEKLRVATLCIPNLLIQPIVACVRIFPAYHEINAAMLNRMNEDLVFDHGDAARDLEFSPRAFLASADTKITSR